MSSIRIDPRTGSIVVRSYAGVDAATGKTRQVSRTLPPGATDEEIAQTVEEVELKAGRAKRTGSGYTVGALLDYYLDGLVDYGHAASTVAAYRSMARCYVHPGVGRIEYDRASASDFSALYRSLLRSGGKDGSPLSPVTVRKLHAMLSGCFSTLMRDGVVDSNPVLGVAVPRGGSPEAKPLSERDFAALAARLHEVLAKPVEDDAGYMEQTFAAAWLTCLHTGVRRGELAGFQVGDWSERIGMDMAPGGEASWHPGVRVSRSVAQVPGMSAPAEYKEPKSERGKRVLTVDDETAGAIRSQIALQQAVMAERGCRQTDETPLFSHPDGTWILPSEFTAEFRALAKSLKLAKHVHLHTLRHTHATYLLSHGEAIKVVQERLGHSKIDVTLGIYGHVLPGRDARAAESFGALSKSMVERACSAPIVSYAPKCPLSGETCARFYNPSGKSNA